LFRHAEISGAPGDLDFRNEEAHLRYINVEGGGFDVDREIGAGQLTAIEHRHQLLDSCAHTRSRLATLLIPDEGEDEVARKPCVTGLQGPNRLDAHGDAGFEIGRPPAPDSAIHHCCSEWILARVSRPAFLPPTRMNDIGVADEHQTLAPPAPRMMPTTFGRPGRKSRTMISCIPTALRSSAR